MTTFDVEERLRFTNTTTAIWTTANGTCTNSKKENKWSDFGAIAISTDDG